MIKHMVMESYSELMDHIIKHSIFNQGFFKYGDLDKGKITYKDKSVYEVAINILGTYLRIYETWNWINRFYKRRYHQL